MVQDYSSFENHFIDGKGRAARALASRILYLRGFDIKRQIITIVPVSSSNPVSVGHDPENMILEIGFYRTKHLRINRFSDS